MNDEREAMRKHLEEVHIDWEFLDEEEREEAITEQIQFDKNDAFGFIMG